MKCSHSSRVRSHSCALRWKKRTGASGKREPPFSVILLKICFYASFLVHLVSNIKLLKAKASSKTKNFR